MNIGDGVQSHQLPERSYLSDDSLNIGISSSTLKDRIQSINEHLPALCEPHSDKYFHRTLQTLEGDGLNPWIKAQVFVRKGPGEIGGIEEALAMLLKYSKIQEYGGSVHALPEGSSYDPRETVMVFEGKAQDLVLLETLYLGAISGETTRLNEGISKVNLELAQDTMEQVRTLIGERPIIYGGARHWSYRDDVDISAAAFAGGASECSTDNGASPFQKEGVGTVPHFLENIYAWRYGPDNAVVEATLAFNRHMPPNVPRVSLIDYNNRELDDALAVAEALEGRLQAVRVDTCGENLAQGALISADCPGAMEWRSKGIDLPDAKDPEAKYWYGNGVTVSGVYALRKHLDEHGYTDVKIILSSGFADPKKVAAFIAAEERLETTLFDSLLVGAITKPCRAATMDVIAVGDSPDSLVPVSKVGRPESPNDRLVPLLQSGKVLNYPKESQSSELTLGGEGVPWVQSD